MSRVRVPAARRCVVLLSFVSALCFCAGALAADPAYTSLVALAQSDQAHDVLKAPAGIAVDPLTGDVYGADTKHQQIVVVPPSGAIRTLAAGFKEPKGIAFDANGRVLYVADSGNHMVTRVTSGGVVTILAGSGKPGHRDGAGATSEFKFPGALAVDSTGNVYVADTGNNVVRRIATDGSVTTFAGSGRDGFADGAAAEARFAGPDGIAVSAAGVVYVADTGNDSIRAIGGGNVTTLAARAAGLKQPRGMCLEDGGNLLIADSGNGVVRRLSLTSGALTTIALTSTMREPAAVACAGALYVADAKLDAVFALWPELRLTSIDPAAGPLAGGNELRLFGTGFVPGRTTLKFDSDSISGVHWLNAGELSFTAPSHAEGTVDVTVTTPAGSATLPDGYTYLPPPSIVSIEPRKGRTAGGEPAIIRGDRFVIDGTTFRFGTAAATGVVVIDPTRASVTTPAVPSGAVDVTVRTAAGEATLANAFHYFAPPAISNFLPASGLAGTEVVIRGANFDPEREGNEVRFGAIVATVLASTASEIIVVVPASAVTAPLFVTTAGGTVGSTQAFVVPVVVSLTITPASFSLESGESRQLTATATWSDGATREVTSECTWTSDDATVATVTAGRVQAASGGVTKIRAAFQAKSAAADLEVGNSAEIPPDPASIAPPFPPGSSPSLGDSVSFLYTGPNPIQQGVTPGAISDVRVGVIRGRLLGSDGQPLPGVTVTIADHPSLGHTNSRADGAFDLAVNGGGDLTVRYERDGYLPAERQVRAPKLDYVAVDDVLLTRLDQAVTTITTGAAAPQVARGSVMVDDDGTRRATLIFAAGTTATMIMPDGSQQTLPSMNVRATEYTVGPNGPAAMPAPLPPQSAYTYCVELSVDQALSAGAASVQFSKPVAFYVENFLGFAPGFRIPAASYDRVRRVWVPSADAKVVRITGIASGAAQVDTNGDNVADDLGIDLAERQQLAALYPAGTTLWRATLAHFTPFDINAPIVYPPGVSVPSGAPTSYGAASCDFTRGGSIIECTNQSLGEVVAVSGTEHALHYQSDRTSGRVASRTLDLRLTGATAPPSVGRIDVEVAIAGTVTRRSFDPLPNQTFRFVWDGRDAYGRAVPGGARVFVRTSYVYDGEYAAPAQTQASFGLAGGLRSGVPARVEVRTTQLWEGTLGSWVATAQKIGGWTITPHHVYDTATRTLHRGDGTRKTDVPQKFGTTSGVLETIAGRAGVLDPSWGGGAGLAKGKAIGFVRGMVVAPDGTIYLSSWGGSAAGSFDHHYIHKITPDGQLVRVAGVQNGTKPTDAHVAQPAATTRLWMPRGLALGPDGSLYVAEEQLYRVRRITPDGMIHPFAGNGTWGTVVNGTAATASRLAYPTDVKAAPDGSVYILSSESSQVVRVGPDGIVNIVAGNGQYANSQDGVPATTTGIDPTGGSLAIGVDGSLLVTDLTRRRIRRIGPDGIISTFAGTGVRGTTGDGGPATAANVNVGGGDNTSLTVSPDGSLYFQDAETYVRRVDPSGTINTVVANGTGTSAPDRSLATASALRSISAVTSDASGSLYFYERAAFLLRTVKANLPRFSGAASDIAVGDGQLVHIFDSAGRHLRTVAADTGAVVYTMGYDAGGLLVSIADHDGNVTSVERKASGDATAIVAPSGQRTLLDGAPYLESITTAPGETTRFQYSALGLMTSMKDPRQKETTFDWNTLGLLTRDADPEGGAQAIVRVDTASGHRAEVTTAGGRTTRYTAETLPNGDTSRTMIDPANLTATTLARDTGLTTNTAPDGTTISSREAPDPVWGMQSPFTQTGTITWPSGRTITTTATREATFTDPADPLSLLTRTDRATVNGKTTTRVFSKTALTDTVTTPRGFTFTRLLNAAGRTRRVERPGFLPTDLTYDSRGRLESVAQGSRSTTYGYNTRNELSSVTDPLSRTVSFEYDGAGRVTKQILPDLRVIAFTYDAAGNLTSIAPPGRDAHTFTYNGVNLSTGYDPPLLAGTGRTEYIYNVDRELERVIRPDGTALDFGYDTAGRLSTLGFGNRSLTYTYNTGGNLSSITGADANLGYTYDGSLPTGMTWSGAVAGNLAWTYNTDGLLATESVDGQSIAFTYDADGMLTAAGALTIARRSDSNLIDFTKVGSAIETLELDGHGGLDALYHELPTTTTSFDYTRDAAGRIKGVVETTGTVETVTGYLYDGAGRLNEVLTGNGRVRYTYDANGNRIAKETTAGAAITTETAAYDAQDRLTNYEGTLYTYTAAGDRRTKSDAGGSTTYEYDALGNLRKVTLPGNVEIEYLVDAQNRRVGRKVNGVPTHKWLYADRIRIIAETDYTRGLTKRFVYGTRFNIPDYVVANGVTYRIFTDHLGSPRTVVHGATGATVQALRFDEFGVVIADTNPGFVPFGFAGGLSDAATKLVRFGARDYDPRTGRWTAKDPILFGGGDTSLYSYSFGDPVNFIDPDGLSGILTIHSSGREGSSDTFLAGHSWISYTPDGGTRTTFGTYGNHPNGGANGLHEGLELKRAAEYGMGDASRSVWIDDVREQALFKLIDDYRKLGEKGWTSGRTCSSFASDAWYASIGERLKASDGSYYPNPTVLRESILKANGGGVAHRRVRVKEMFGPVKR